MTTTTLTFLVILLSITTLAFFILSIFAIRRSNRTYKYLEATQKDLGMVTQRQSSSLKIIDNQDRKISEITRDNERLQKDKDTLTYKLQDELRFQEEQIQKQKDILIEEYEEKITSLNHQIDSAAKDNKELLSLIENLEKLSNERLEEIKRLTNT